MRASRVFRTAGALELGDHVHDSLRGLGINPDVRELLNRHILQYGDVVTFVIFQYRIEALQAEETEEIYDAAVCAT